MATTVRVEDDLANVLRELAREESRPIGQVIEDAITRYRHEKFWREVEESVERLRQDQRGWRDYQEETAALEGGSMDGLTDEEPYYTDQEIREIRGQNT